VLSAFTTLTPDAVQATGDGVPAAAELAAGVQDGEDHLHGRFLLHRVHVDGDAAAVVDHADAAVVQQRDLDLRAEAGQRLVDGVVDDLLHQVVQAARPGGADVHAGALADRLQTLEHGDVARVVARGDADAAWSGAAGAGSDAASGAAAGSAASLPTGEVLGVDSSGLVPSVTRQCSSDGWTTLSAYPPGSSGPDRPHRRGARIGPQRPLLAERPPLAWVPP
jgi:hypothetical protein